MRRENANTLWAAVFVDELIRCGLQVAVIAPGSRSTPLVLQLSGRQEVRDFSVIDERSAGFLALGIARTTGRPVAVVCTSGTAAANLYPAVCEASASGVPLVVLSADRPRELHGVGASQAMDQIHLYGSHMRAFFQAPQAEATAEKLRFMRGLACRVMARASGAKPGPVHINLPFRKPLGPIEVGPEHRDAVPGGLADEAPVAWGGRPDGAPFLRICRGPMVAAPAMIDGLAQKIGAAERPLIVAGADAVERGRGREVLEAIGALNVPVVAEWTSGLRGRAGEAVVVGASVVGADEFFEVQGTPDLLIRLGRAPILWSGQRWLRGLRGVKQVLVGPGSEPADPEHLASWQIQAEPEQVFGAIKGGAGATRGAGRGLWLEAFRHAAQGERRGLKREDGSSALTAPRVWRGLGESLPQGAALVVSSSMPLRDMESFLGDPRGVEVFANRGVNGIDGVVSTGLGAALGRAMGPTVIVVGDVALRHDLSALLLGGELGIDATVVVVDNGAGAIFDYLPLAAKAQRTGGDLAAAYKKHFSTPGSLEGCADGFGGIEFERPVTGEEFEALLAASMDRRGLQVIAVKTDADEDRRARERVIAAMVEEVGDGK